MNTVYMYGSRKTGLSSKTILFGLIPPQPTVYVDPKTGLIISGAEYAKILKEQGAAIQQARDLKAVAEKAKIDEQRRLYDVELASAKQKAIDDLHYDLYKAGSSKDPGKPEADGSSFSKFILPIGAGLAALFFLKGH